MKPADNSVVRFKGLLASDADILFSAAFGNTGVMQYLQWETHICPDETRVLIEEMIDLHQRGDKYFWTAHYRSDDRIVGLASIKPDSDTAWIGFLVLSGEQRKGFGSAIISALEDVVLSRFESVSALVEVRNRSSVNLLRKAGWSEWANADVSPLVAYRKQKANKAWHPTGRADVSDLPFSNSNLPSASNEPPRPSGGCA